MSATKDKAKRDRKDRALVQDSLKRYLADIRKYPILDREEEVETARAAQAGDAEAAAKLVNSNLRLVVKIALEYQSTRISLLDLIQEGNVGLMRAVRKFDPERKIRLSTYAQFWIRAFVLKYLMDNYKLVKVGTTQAQRKLFYNLKKEKEKLRQQGIDPTAERIAKRLDVREKDVREMETRLSGREVSLDAPVNDGESGTMMDLIPGSTRPADHEFDQHSIRKHLGERLQKFRGKLEGRDIHIWDKRLVAEDPYTLQQLGDLFGVSRERARQLEARIVKRLRKFLDADQEYLSAMDFTRSQRVH